MASLSICGFLHCYQQLRKTGNPLDRIKLNVEAGYIHMHWGW